MFIHTSSWLARYHFCHMTVFLCRYIARHNAELAQAVVDAGAVPLLVLCIQVFIAFLQHILRIINLNLMIWMRLYTCTSKYFRVNSARMLAKIVVSNSIYKVSYM